MNFRLLSIFLLGAALASIAIRLLPHPANFVPVGALALFAGAYASTTHRWVLLLPAACMFVSDLFIGFYDFKLMAAVYGSFVLYGVLGRVIAQRVTVARVLLGAFAGALAFFLLTNFAVWAFSAWYPHTLQGLLQSYAMALPFFRLTLLGDMMFSGLLFGGYELSLFLVRRFATRASYEKTKTAVV